MLDKSQQRQTGAILSYAYSGLSAIVGLLYVPILLSTMGDSEYGLYQLIGSIMAYMSLMNSIFSGGITRYYCKYLVAGETEKMKGILAAGRQIYTVMSFFAIAVGVVLIFVFWIAYSAVLTEFQMLESAVMIVAISINLIISMQNSLSVAVIVANERFVFQRGLQLVLLILQPVVVVCLVGIFPCAALVPLVQLFLNVVIAVVQRLFASRKLGMEIVKSANQRSLIRKLLFFSTGLLLVMIADQVFWRTNQLILGFFYGMTVVAAYSVASQIVTSYMAIGVTIPQVFLPKVTELISSDLGIKAVSELFIKVGRLTMYPLLLVLTGFWIFGVPFIQLWAGEGFEEAYYIAMILMIAATIDLSQNLGLTILQVINKYHVRGIVYVLLALGNCVLVFALAPVFGAVGAALCSAIAMFVGNGVVMNVYYSKFVGLKIGTFWMNILRVSTPLLAIGSVVYCAICSFQFAWDWQTLVIAIILYSTIYLTVAIVFSMNNYERNLIKRLVFRFLGNK